MKRIVKITNTSFVVALFALGILLLWKPTILAEPLETIKTQNIPTPEEPIIEYDTDFVDLAEYIPGITVDVRYATNKNFMKKTIYDSPQALLRRGTAKKLKAVAEAVAKQGYRLKIWDAYRPTAAQFKMWEIRPDENFVANPYKGGSNHSRGCTVDITLVKADGTEMDMPTSFDDFTSKAGTPFPVATSVQKTNANYLADIMVDAGFEKLNTEWWHYTDSDKKKYEIVEKAALSPSREKTNITISCIGDNTFGTALNYKGIAYSNMDFYLKKYQSNYFFTNVKNIFKQDDLTIANLEGSITDSTERADKTHQGDNAFFFSGNPDYLDGLKNASIDAVNLANNHSSDFGRNGYTDTQNTLNQKGITSFGDEKIAFVTIKGIKVALIGINTLGPLEQGTSISDQKAQVDKLVHQANSEGAKLILASFHWGTEHSPEITNEQKELAHYAIDKGIHQVIGHHPHVLQPIEIYKGKTIAYSVGNFVFGGNTAPPDKDSMILQQTFEVDSSGAVQPFEPLRIPVLISSSKKINDYQPVLAEGEDRNRIFNKLGK